MGAGASGNVLADNLSGHSTRPSVLLVEAGGDDSKSPEVHMPASAEDLQGGEFDFKYKTVTQKRACRGLVNQVRVCVLASLHLYYVIRPKSDVYSQVLYSIFIMLLSL